MRLIVALVVYIAALVVAEDGLLLPPLANIPEVADLALPLIPNSRPPDLDLRLDGVGDKQYYAPQLLHQYLVALQHFWLLEKDEPIKLITPVTDPAYKDRYTRFAPESQPKQPFGTREALWATVTMIDKSLDQFSFPRDFNWHMQGWIITLGNDIVARIFVSEEPVPTVANANSVMTERRRRKRQSNTEHEIHFATDVPYQLLPFYPVTLLRIFRDFAAHLMGHHHSDLAFAHYIFNKPYVLEQQIPAGHWQPGPYVYSGVKATIMILPTESEEPSDITKSVQIEELVDCLLGILEKIGEDWLGLTGFHEWDAKCVRKGGEWPTVLEVKTEQLAIPVAAASAAES